MCSHLVRGSDVAGRRTQPSLTLYWVGYPLVPTVTVLVSECLGEQNRAYSRISVL